MFNHSLSQYNFIYLGLQGANWSLSKLNAFGANCKSDRNCSTKSNLFDRKKITSLPILNSLSLNPRDSITFE